MRGKIRITVFGEHNQDRYEPVKSIYPEGIHTAIAQAFDGDSNFEVSVVTMDQPYHGFPDEVIDNTDVFIWWSHLDGMAFDDTIADKVCKRVVEGGAGFFALHSAIFCKPWLKMTGTFYDTGAWGKYRVTRLGEKSRHWIVCPGHPIFNGIEGEYIEIPHDELYGEPLFVTEPDKVLSICWWEGGEVCRSACLYDRGRGKLFMFTPGHETYPIYYREDMRRIIRNAAYFLAPSPEMVVPPREFEHLKADPVEDLTRVM